VIAVAALVALRPRELAPMGPFTARPITSEPGNERDPDVSSDGKYIAWAYEAPSLRTRIAVRLIDGGDPHYITDGAVDEWSPVWSPDGARVAVTRRPRPRSS
jgi:Tol biopolymer transport system component